LQTACRLHDTKQWPAYCKVLRQLEVLYLPGVGNQGALFKAGLHLVKASAVSTRATLRPLLLARGLRLALYLTLHANVHALSTDVSLPALLAQGTQKHWTASRHQ
jgi:hypothetical protein